jgi:DNA replication and repair protein RecF
MEGESEVGGCRLSLVRVSHLRNIGGMEFEPADGDNLFIGANGAGKTSILEAIYLLMRGHSFRERALQPVVQKGEKRLTVFGRVQKNGLRIEIGVEKSGSGTVVRRNGEGVRRLSEIAGEVPLLILTPETVAVLDGEPEHRRRLVDWGVFHVEHSYRELAARYQRALAQRNSALKLRDVRAVVAWEGELSLAGEGMDAFRRDYVEALAHRFEVERVLLGAGFDAALAWHRGWPEGASLEESLRRSRDSDLERGFTQSGPHRADLAFTAQGVVARRHLSRGQKKILLFGVLMAQAEIIGRRRGIHPILLLDDLASELDESSKQAVRTRLTQYSSKMFHVEHGGLIR